MPPFFSHDLLKDRAPRKTAENTAKHRDGGVGLVVANHRGGCESSVVVTTLLTSWSDDVEAERNTSG